MRKIVIIMKIYELRLIKGYSLKKLSTLTHISATHLNDIERNIKIPSIRTLILIAYALDVPVTDLYEAIL